MLGWKASCGVSHHLVTWSFQRNSRVIKWPPASGPCLFLFTPTLHHQILERFYPSESRETDYRPKNFSSLRHDNMASRSMSREEIARQYENYSIYVILSSRGANPGFHWGIFIPTNTPLGHLWHATNREGGWMLDQRPSNNVPYSLSLVLARKIGAVNDSNWQTCKDILNGVAAGPHPSPNTGEQFDCRIWVKDAIIALENNGIIALDKGVPGIEDDLLVRASDLKPHVEYGSRPAKVENSGD